MDKTAEDTVTGLVAEFPGWYFWQSVVPGLWYGRRTHPPTSPPLDTGPGPVPLPDLAGAVRDAIWNRANRART